jgi:hypothetical protein
MVPQPARKRLAKGVRLWAKFFAPVCNSDSIEVPLGWEFFLLPLCLIPQALIVQRIF